MGIVRHPPEVVWMHRKATSGKDTLNTLLGAVGSHGRIAFLGGGNSLYPCPSRRDIVKGL